MLTWLDATMLMVLHAKVLEHLQEAALEKLLAGEGRNVEHVALQTDETLGLTPPPQRQLRRLARKAGPTGGPSGGQR